jgi:hypothetical protein
MLEREVIQHKGFRNIVEDGKVVGFQVGIRQNVYRGTWLSQFRFDHLTVDGEKYGPEDVTFLISGIEYTYDEMADKDRIKWPRDEVAYIRVRKEGGLGTGAHTVSVNFWQIRSYLPVRMDGGMPFGRADTMTRELVLV